MKQLVFVDIETTGLDPYQHAIIEIACVKEEEEQTWVIELTETELGRASPQALTVNQYYKRFKAPHPSNMLYSPMDKPQIERSEIAWKIAEFTEGCVLAGNTVKFDQQFLEVWLRRHGACPVWDYHVLDVPTFCAGYITRELKDIDSVSDTGGVPEDYEEMRDAIAPPFSSRTISKALGVPEPKEEHTALGDAYWSRAMYEAVT